MVGLIITTHGQFATGIKQSGEMVFGDEQKVEVVPFTGEESTAELKAKLQATINRLATPEVLFLCDIWGGSPFNQAVLLCKEDEAHRAVLTGLNLPMLVTCYSERYNIETAHSLATTVLNEAREGVAVYPKQASLHP